MGGKLGITNDVHCKPPKGLMTGPATAARAVAPAMCVR
ncbi:hypothetical protein XOC_1205 [Xanthomonas oryzae pv. oryzicola BLS256]|uniref:Uncharacterized protein n=1 Tax=Xanthomonas oryzae pv. oryzicola (strain BLS256) TaxID=383407 RepID=G7TGJ9_XANOB|nr:hypothetical protein XOC_1205 [Xanthomonas oryzae pv. oryzicola BLS256]QEO98727.1 hypothetical protein XOCgx_3738 [Xanthomonas oryzae pv. oryzicola]